MYKKSLDKLYNTLLKLHKIFVRFVRWLDDEKKSDNKLAETDIDLYIISIIT